MSEQIPLTLELSGTNQKNFVSLYWDYENINEIENKANLLINFARQRGYLVNLKVYAKISIWQHKKGKDKVALKQLGFDCVEVSQTGKNGVDFQVVIDCVTESNNNISTNLFILVTSDGDYEILVRELQNKGKKVIIFYHPDKVSQTLIQIASEAYSVEELPELVNNKASILDVSNQIDYKVAVQCLLEAINVAGKQVKPTSYPLIDQLMRQNEQFPNYQGVSSIRKPDGTTFSKFSKFVEAVQAEGKVQVRCVGKEKELFIIEQNRQAA